MNETTFARLAKLVLDAERDKKRSIPVAEISKILIEAHITSPRTEPAALRAVAGD